MDYYDYGSYASSGSSTGSTVFGLFIDLALIVANWFLFVKANEPGWMSIIPILNVWKLYEIVYGAGWKCLLLLVPILNIAVLFMLPFRLCQAYGKGILWGVLMLLCPPIMTLVLAFSPSATYRGPCYSFL